MKRKKILAFGLMVCALLGGIFGMGPKGYAENEPEVMRFDIREIKVSGNDLIPENFVRDAVAPFTGPKKSAEDVEKARVAVEQIFHRKGYPTVTVDIPPQDVADGIIDLTVQEGRINHVRIKGNRYFTMGKIARDLPIFAPGELIYLPDAKTQLNKINMNPDLKVKPDLMPGRDGGVDVVLNVEDKLPLHGSLEVNNRASANTTDLRINGAIHYDNLWQREHSLSLQLQITPEDTSEVKALSFSYLIHAPWKYAHLLAAYAVFSNSQVAFGEGFLVKGKGQMGGIRYVIPLNGTDSFVHNTTLGIDYKNFGDKMYQGGDEFLNNEAAPYMPVSFAYQAAWMMSNASRTTVNAGLTLIPRGLAMDEDKLEEKRYNARSNPVVLKLGMEYAAALPEKFGLNIKADGQVADQPLVSNEQLSAGGMESVRGYYESELTGDMGILCSVELAAPEMVRLFGKEKEDGEKTVPRYKVRPYVFYDMAQLWVKDPLPDEEKPGMIQGTGFGVRGFVTRHLIYGLDWGFAMNRTSHTDAGDYRINFRMKWAF